MKLTVSKMLNIALLSMLLIILVASATTGTSEDGYDAWVDYDENGVIDQTDLYHFSRSYGETGNPTKNVNVTNWPTQQREPVYKMITIWDKKYFSWVTRGVTVSMMTEKIHVGGYSTMVVYLLVTNISQVQYGTTDVYVASLAWYPHSIIEHTPDEPFRETVDNPKHELYLADTGWAGALYEVKSPILHLEIDVFPQSYLGNALVSLCIYLRND